MYDFQGRRIEYKFIVVLLTAMAKVGAIYSSVSRTVMWKVRPLSNMR